MAQGFNPFIKSIGIIVLLGFVLIMFMNTIIPKNNPSTNIYVNNSINGSLNAFNSSLNSLRAAANDTSGLVSQAQVSPSYLFLIFKEAISIPQNIMGFLINGVSAIVYLPILYIFGDNSPFYVVPLVIGATILFTIAFLALRAMRTGETER